MQEYTLVLYTRPIPQGFQSSCKAIELYTPSDGTYSYDFIPGPLHEGLGMKLPAYSAFY